MQVGEAWSARYNGSGITVAILDDGLQTNHTDLDANVDKLNDYDYQDWDDSPMPPNGSSHGTNVAGLIAAERDNNDCIVGVAYACKIIGVRLIGSNGITDSQEAQALSHCIDKVDIYSNSWGPTDGYGFWDPGVLTKSAIQEGVTNGRNGKGVIYTWAAGNGGPQDNCNADGYVNSIYTIGITSVQQGQNAWYSEVCAAALAATYGGSEQDRYLITTSIFSECSEDNVQGTSFSTPIATGIIALALQANPDLTWRDIQHLIVFTSSRNGFNDTIGDWATNGANKEFSLVLGFGLMNAIAMVTQAQSWTTVPAQQTYTTITRNPSLKTSGEALSTDKIEVTTDCPIRFLEHVTIDITFSYSSYRGVTEIFLLSPSATYSNLLHVRINDANKFVDAGSLSWTFMSVHFWWENPIGSWNLYFGSAGGHSVVTLDSWSLTLYGTTTQPVNVTLSDTQNTDKPTSGPDSTARQSSTKTLNGIFSTVTKVQDSTNHKTSGTETAPLKDNTESYDESKYIVWIIIGVVCLIAVGGIIPVVLICIKKCSPPKKVGQTPKLVSPNKQRKSNNIPPIRTTNENKSNNIPPVSNSEQINSNKLQPNSNIKEGHLYNLPPSSINKERNSEHFPPNSNKNERTSNHLPPISNEKKKVQPIKDLGQPTTSTLLPLTKNRDKLPSISKFPLNGSHNDKITA
ncbi:neuroendocrine convertase 2-like [Mytilus californianus]|uniref:neuroendocrine convertase 2-like n=1 Tax=Mytilus californianus TaxID=6549 RepID=UPI002247913F|nr:neuroendocrine convertase 2-like [Mytilus californianus]